VGTRCADHVTPLYPQKFALNSPTGGGRSVGIVRVRTKATEYSLVRLEKFLHLPGPWKGSVYMRGPEVETSLASRSICSCKLFIYIYVCVCVCVCVLF